MIKTDKDGIALVSSDLKHKLPSVWQAIQLNYFYISNKNINNLSKKLQRWWRKASGFHDGFKLEGSFNFNLTLPPILYRQSHQCEPPVMYDEIPYYRENGLSAHINTKSNPWNNLSASATDDPIICYRQRKMIVQLKIINGWVCKNTPKRFNKRSFQQPMSKENIYKLSKNPKNLHRNPYKKICCCSGPKAEDYIKAVRRNKKYILKIFQILAEDEINVKTRMKLSNFLITRFS
jgi:hypothetical protein|uniref:Uncharacterized protein n=1 Tax=viral metagenome TaxID=1070528 RepID=A0A6C0C007_9ZZZZ